MRELTAIEIELVSGGDGEEQQWYNGAAQGSGNGNNNWEAFGDVWATPVGFGYDAWPTRTVTLQNGPNAGQTSQPGPNWQSIDPSTGLYWHYDQNGRFVADGLSPMAGATNATVRSMFGNIGSNALGLITDHGFISIGATVPLVGPFGLGGGVAYSYNTGVVLHGGGGIAGPSVQVGLAADTSGYLTGPAWSLGASGIGAGGWDRPTAFFVGNFQGGISYGVRLSDVVNQAQSQFYTFGQQFSDGIYDRLGRPYDPPAEPQP